MHWVESTNSQKLEPQEILQGLDLEERPEVGHGGVLEVDDLDLLEASRPVEVREGAVLGHVQAAQLLQLLDGIGGRRDAGFARRPGHAGID